MDVVVGSYEELSLGYQLTHTDGKWEFQQMFTDHSHCGGVRDVAISKKKILATGSSDETIKLFDLDKKVELGSLMEHEGTITSLSFYEDSHLFSGSEDGKICIWKTSGWDCIKTLKGHKGPVLSVSVHPSGKLALSVGKDKTLRTWNLITGRAAFITNIKEVAESVHWSPDGGLYAVVFPNRVDIYDVEKAAITDSICCEFRVQVVTFMQSNWLIVGGDQGIFQICDLDKKSKVCTMNTGTNRIKGIGCCQMAGDTCIVTASSDGFIKAWKLSKDVPPACELLTEVNTKFRLTCLTVATKEQESVSNTQKKELENVISNGATGKKRKRKRGKFGSSQEPEKRRDQNIQKTSIEEEKAPKKKKKRKQATKGSD
ncbi:p21-activated protein kinase-interacting protein 1-like [Lingula anatina]|uniref:P21-activated protein kinase-interacting protein 1-like n=1 Tax=Lingula anatina TaxID=7574 RepID=A0A1S3JL15_LINAN|nr:p21-activated protein kinase-interacting protein 1-like [Lingula anatina]|eukprot:XP_013410594.1 p21-activated protein kinase-interacting protein 1-like [Lingula anatina]